MDYKGTFDRPLEVLLNLSLSFFTQAKRTFMTNNCRIYFKPHSKIFLPSFTVTFQSSSTKLCYVPRALDILLYNCKYPVQVTVTLLLLFG